MVSALYERRLDHWLWTKSVLIRSWYHCDFDKYTGHFRGSQTRKSCTLPLLFCEKSTIFRLFPDRVPTELFRSDLQSVQVQTKENTTISSTRKLFGLVVQSFQVQNHRNLGPTHNPKIIRNHFIKFPSWKSTNTENPQSNHHKHETVSQLKNYSGPFYKVYKSKSTKFRGFPSVRSFEKMKIQFTRSPITKSSHHCEIIDKTA